MLITPQKVEVKWHPRNVEYYESHGYIKGNIGSAFFVNIEHLSLGSTFLVKIQCDYCEDKYDQKYKIYLKHFDKSPIKKDACSKCTGKKREESNLLVYGVKMPSALPDVQEKMKATNMERFGAPNPHQSKEWKKEHTRRFVEKHGVENPSQIPEVSEKISKARIAYFKRLDELGERKTNFRNNKTKQISFSKQQVYIHSVTGGIFNHSIGRYHLDIAFPEDKVFVEYDGGGHDLPVKLGNMTKDEFLLKEKRRFRYLYKQGWREIRIISLKDKMPSKEELLLIINEAYKKLMLEPHLMRVAVDLEKRDIEIKEFKRRRSENGETDFKLHI